MYNKNILNVYSVQLVDESNHTCFRMPRISKRKIDSLLEKRMYELFWDYIAELRSPGNVHEFLSDLFTRTERITLAKRLSVAILLAKGYTFDEIDDFLKVSKGTITTIARQVASGAPGYEKAIRHVLSNQKLDAFFDTLEEISLKLSLPKRHGSFRYHVKSESSRNLSQRKATRLLG